MADPVTNNYSFTEPTVGGDNGTWGGFLNTDWVGADAALGNNLAVSISASDVALTTAQMQNKAFICSGALTGNRNLIIPLSPNSATVACGGHFIVVNNCSGNFNLTVKTAAVGSTGVTIPQGGVASVFSDGTNVIYDNKGGAGVAYALASNGNPNGQLAGTAGSVNANPSIAYDYANNIFYVCTTTGNAGSAVWTRPSSLVPRGFDTAVNLRLNVTAAANALTIAVKTADTNADPSAIDPVVVPFRDVTLANGDPVTINITSALSIVLPTGATLGVPNNQSFAGWLVLFNNAGTAVLGVINCSTTNSVFALDETGVASAALVSAGSTNPGVFYGNAAVVNKAFRVIGFFSYETALVTAGTYNVVPDVVQLFGSGVRLPGTVVNRQWGTANTTTTTTSTTPVPTNTTASITPRSKKNLIKITAKGTLQVGANVNAVAVQLSRGSGPSLIGNLAGLALPTGVAGAYVIPVPLDAFDLPQTVGAQSYTVYIKSPDGQSISWIGSLPTSGGTAVVTSSTILLEEIVG
jgi:hypothetical protein